MLDTMTSREHSYRKTRNGFSDLINRVTRTRSQDSGHGQLKHMLMLKLVQRNRPLKASSDPLTLQDCGDAKISIFAFS